MTQENGNINIHTENILPIIKKWLYSDKDIFIRELISNSCDAITKLKSLSLIGEADIDSDEKYLIKVVINKEKKTLQIIDNGIGMTGEEIKKYINQIAFSGAEDFIAKYKDKTDENNQIIGHFGLGFYSAFMVAEQVQIDTLSYQKDAEGVKWVCAGGMEYEISPSEHSQRGTCITLYIADDSTEFLEESTLRQVINKYCSFMPIEIYLEDENAQKEMEEKEEETPEPLNDTYPLWLKNPKDCTDEEYKEFYQKVFFDFQEPLFWIHLNVDHPFNLKGILYFPKLKHEFESNEGKIKLFNNQVFVADNIKEIIPEFLMLLKGVVECEDLPLNVSRSFLQKDTNVIRISKHITKKVADKLSELFTKERDNYNKFWDDINPFIKYGCMRDDKFYDRVKDIIIYKTINGEYVNLTDYLEKNKEKHENKVFYVSDEKQQAQYINLFKEQELDAVILSSSIDPHFIQFMESKESDVKFNRIDSDLSESLKNVQNDEENEQDKEEQIKLENIFKESLANDKLKIQVENLKATEVPAIILLSEESRRMQDMSMMYGGGMDMMNMFPSEETMVLNKNNNLVQLLFKLDTAPDKKEDVKLICEQIYDLAMMSHKQLETNAMTNFIARSNKILTLLAQEKCG